MDTACNGGTPLLPSHAMAGFVKLDTGILNSSLWHERDVRDVFITALLMAVPDEVTEPIPALDIVGSDPDPTGFVVPPGWYGFVPAASVGIAHMAGVDRETGIAALRALASPELESRTPDHEGRRMVRVPGGFIVLNWEKYRQRDYTSTERSRRWRERQRQAKLRDAVPEGGTGGPNGSGRQQKQKQKQSTEVPEQAAAPPRARAVARPDDVPADVWEDFRALRKTKRAPLTPTAWKRLTSEVEKAGWTVQDALQECVTRGWAGFKSEWVKNRDVVRANAGKSHAPQQTRHNSDLDIGDPACECMSCRAWRRDNGRSAG